MGVEANRYSGLRGELTSVPMAPSLDETCGTVGGTLY